MQPTCAKVCAHRNRRWHASLGEKCVKRIKGYVPVLLTLFRKRELEYDVTMRSVQLADEPCISKSPPQEDLHVKFY